VSSFRAVETTFRSLNDLTLLAASWQLHLEAANLSPKTIRSYLDSARQLQDHLAAKGMPTAIDAITREHVESFLVAVRQRISESTSATRYRVPTAVFRMATG
jgi:site-specific recombinase XerD